MWKRKCAASVGVLVCRGSSSPHQPSPGCTNATDGGVQAAAFRLIRNNSWLANEEETVCQEVPWTSRETLFQSPGPKKKINADASSQKWLGG